MTHKHLTLALVSIFAFLLIFSMLTTQNFQLHSNYTDEEQITIQKNQMSLNAIGVPQPIALPIGMSVFLQYFLLANKSYVINLYGGFIGTNVDYDVYIYSSNFTLIKRLLNDPGIEEFYIFQPTNSDIYNFQIINNPQTSVNQTPLSYFVIFELANLTELHYNTSVSNLIGSNKTYTSPLVNSSYGFFLDVKKFQMHRITFTIKPTSKLSISAKLYSFTTYLDKHSYWYTNSTESIIEKENGAFGEQLNISFIVGMRGNEHVNDTYVVIFIRALKGTGNISINIDVQKVTFEIEILLPYMIVIIAILSIFILIVIYEEKIRFY